MSSDNDYDIFDYKSSQDPFEIDYQIDLFELRLSLKFDKSKRKFKKPSCSLSLKARKSQPKPVTVNCMNNKKTNKTAEQKTIDNHCSLKKPKVFECDKKFHIKRTVLSNSIPTSSSQQPICLQSNMPSSSSKIFSDKDLKNFSNFRRHFYRINYQKIKSSLQNHNGIDIINIRLAPIKQSVQNDFMKTLNENTSYLPELVYHGTKLDNIKSILDYGFLIPNQAHPSNSEAPIIVLANGQSYGSGIYSSHSAVFSLSYGNATNTLLACAAIPKRDSVGNIERSHGDILVLSHESQIIPLYLIDFKYRKTWGVNYPYFNQAKHSKINKKNEVQK